MLKQWLFGRKKSSPSTKILAGHLQDPNIICSLGDRYVVYRTNPIYVADQDSHWLEALSGNGGGGGGKQSQISALAPHDPKLHVQAWCSLVCPKHLTTCCACKPAWIYCDNCHPPPPPVGHQSPKVLPLPSSPDVLPAHHHTDKERRRSSSRDLAHRNRFPDLTLSPSHFQSTDPGATGSHFYHVIDPLSDETQNYALSTATAASSHVSKKGGRGEGRLDLSHSRRHRPHYRHRRSSHLNQPVQQQQHRPNMNDRQYRHYHQRHQHQPPAQQRQRPEGKRAKDKNKPSNKENVVDSGGVLQKSPPLLHIYINSDFVSGIAVSGSRNAIMNEAGRDQTSLPVNHADGTNYVYSTVNPFPNGTAGELLLQGQLDLSADTDSLESLRIDERIFAPADGGQQMHSLEDMAKLSSKVAVLDSSSSFPETGSGSDGDGGGDDSRGPPTYSSLENAMGRGDVRQLDTVSPTSSRLLLTDSEAAYEAVKDLYEKLSHNRHRQVLTQALSGTQRGKAIRNYVQNTYETLTKHARMAYSKLVDDDSQRTSSIYILPSESVSTIDAFPQSPKGNIIIINNNNNNSQDSHNVHDDSGRGMSTTASGAYIDVVRNDSDPSPGVRNRDDPKGPDVTRKVSLNDQFITRRDPKYGDQPVVLTTPAQSADVNIYKNLKKRFKQKSYRDACKIVLTTLIGLIAFGIITALSLSINHQ